TPAAGQSGTATITLTVTDAGGMTASDAFVLTVTVPPPPPPPPPPPSGRPFAVGTDGGRAARVTMYNPDGTVRFTALPFGAAYTGGVRVAVGDVTGDGAPDVVLGTGGGAPAQVRVDDEATGSARAWQVIGAISDTGRAAIAAGEVVGGGA